MSRRRRPRKYLTLEDEEGPDEIASILETVIGLEKKYRKTIVDERHQWELRRKARWERILDKAGALVLQDIDEDIWWEKKQETVREQHKKDMQLSRWNRRVRATRNHMTIEDMVEGRDGHRRHLLKTGEMNRKEGESANDASWRLWDTNKVMRDLWEYHGPGIQLAHPRYLEGYPVRQMVSYRHLLPVLKYESTNKSSCLQCRTKNLPCSRTKFRWKRRVDREIFACSRCVRNGQRHECVVPSKNKKGQWKLLDPEKTYLEKKEREENDQVGQELKPVVSAVVKRWLDQENKVVVDIIGGTMQEVTTSAFAPQRPRKWRRLKEWLW